MDTENLYYCTFTEEAFSELRGNPEQVWNIIKGEETIEEFMNEHSIHNFHNIIHHLLLKKVELTAEKKGMVWGENDAKNAIALYDAWKDILTPVAASSEEFWAYLALTEFREYTLARWGELRSNETLKTRVESRILSQRGVSTQGLGRLYWGAYYTWNNKDEYALTELLFSRTDFVQGFIREQEWADNRETLHKILRCIDKMFPIPSEDTIRRLRAAMQAINASSITDNYDDSSIQKIVDKYVK